MRGRGRDAAAGRRAGRAAPAARRRQRRERRPAAGAGPRRGGTRRGRGSSRPTGPSSCPTPTGSATSALFSASTPRMRAWWQDDDHWRVDQLLLTGETDLVHEGGTTLRWDYEHSDATLSRDPVIRLPRTADLVPPVLAERLLRGVTADDVRRVPARRVAGVSAPGLRLVPASDLSSIDHADLWAGPGLRRTAPGRGVRRRDGHRRLHQRVPGVLERPSGELAWSPSTRRAGVDVEFDDVLDIADAANQYAPCARPTPWPGSPKADVVGRRGRCLRRRDDPGHRHPAAQPGGRRPARPARATSRRRPGPPADGWSPSGRSGWCSPERRATAGGCWPGR